jgi:hypothetical protein
MISIRRALPVHRANGRTSMSGTTAIAIRSMLGFAREGPRGSLLRVVLKGGRGVRKRRQAGRTGAELMMGAIILPLASMAHAMPSTISPRMQASTEADTGHWKIAKPSDLVIRCSLISSRTILETHSVPTRLLSSISSTVKGIERSFPMEDDNLDKKFDILGPIFGEIGRKIFEDIGEDPNGVFLYAEAGEGWVEASIFKDKGAFVQYFDASSELCDLIIKAWETEPTHKRWAVMMYEIQDGAFDATFRFPEEIDPEPVGIERREDALRNRYGDKPVRYPPIPQD